MITTPLGSMTLNVPPISSHFGDEKKLQAPWVQPQVPDYQLPYPGPPEFMPYVNPYGYPHYPPYLPPHQGFPPCQGPPMPYNYDLAAQPWHEPLISSLGIAVHLCASLTDFCSCYGISAADEKKLRDVIEYQPGNKLVENLQEKTWGKRWKWGSIRWAQVEYIPCCSLEVLWGCESGDVGGRFVIILVSSLLW